MSHLLFFSLALPCFSIAVGTLVQVLGKISGIQLQPRVEELYAPAGSWSTLIANEGAA